MLLELILIIIVAILVYSGAALATAVLVGAGVIASKKFTVVQNGEVQVGGEKVAVVQVQPVTGSGPEILPGDRYDEYDDSSTLLEKNSKFMSKNKNIVVDGANLIHYIMGGKHGDYFAATEAAIKLVTKLFPKKNIFFTIKEPNDVKNITNRMRKVLDKHNLSVENKDFGTTEEMNEYLSTFEKYTEIFADHRKLHFVFGLGQDKARDDFTAILITDLLGPKTLLLTRDRYRDIINITGSKPNKMFIFGPLAKKIQKQFDGYLESFSAIGTWSIYGRILGYTSGEVDKTMLWSRKPKNSNSSEYVLILGKDIVEPVARFRQKKAIVYDN